MTTYSKPAVRNAWGQTASGTDLVDPGNTYATAGWQIGVKPPRQYFNWVLNYNMAGIRYLCQQGVATWDSNESYAVGSTTLSPSGLLYRCLNANTGQNPDSTIFSYWDIPYVATAQANDNTVRIANTHWVSSYFLPVGSTFLAISGQIQGSQVPASAVTQWQGSLSIGGGQVTSAVARANTLNLVGGSYATFNWSGQAGQPTWLFGSNDGTNVYVWNPTNFSVNNSQFLQGAAPSAAAAGNTVVVRDGSGYIYGQYLNQASGNNENPSISQIMVTNGADNFLRKASLGALLNALIANGLLTSSSFSGSTATNGYVKLPNGIIFQWLTCSPSGGTIFAFFPLVFPNACRCVVATSTGTPTQCNVTGFSTTGASIFNTGGNSYVIAVGF